MHYNFPPVRFVEQNTLYNQLEHIRQEFTEAMIEFMADNLDRCDLEVMDLYHSCETYFRIRERQGVDIQAVYRETCDKNHDRGYYDVDR